MSGPIVEASAPCRVDLAGGTLDIWPLYLLHPGAVTVNVAIDRRAWCRVELGPKGVSIESKDTLTQVEGADLDEVLASGQLSLVAHILRALGVERDVHVATRSRVPAGSGLGGSSALALAVAAAVERALGRESTAADLVALARDAEAQCLRGPAGTQDHWAALRGGVLGLRLAPGGVRPEPLPADPALVEGALLLVDAGVTRFSGLNNWEVFKQRVDGDPTITAALTNIAAVAEHMWEALAGGHYREVPGLLDREWEARKRLAPGVTTPEIDRIVAAARSVGGAAKVCGAGGGGLVAVWADPAEHNGVRAALAEAGFQPFPFRLDLQGLDVEVM